jgi:hypothetical protein
MTRISVRSALLSGIACSALATAAQANGDRTFCIGPSYIAYELRSGTPREHALYVVTLTDSAAIGRPLKIRLPDIVVHAIRCNPTSVELLGWDSLYTVAVEPTRAAAAAPVAQVAPWASQADRRPPPGYTIATLWTGSPNLRAGRPDTIPMSATATTRRFALVRDIRNDPQSRCLYNLRAQVVELDKDGRQLGSLVLVDAVRNRECGGD